MNDEHGSQEPRYATIRDYLSVLRRYWLPILIVSVIGAGAGLAQALRQDSVYEASASIAFQDETRDVGIFGLSSNAVQPAAQVAATKATMVTRPEVLARAQRRLDDEDLSGFPIPTVETVVDPNSALVIVTARSESPELAASYAEAVARQGVAASNRSTRARFAAAARTAREESEEIIKELPDANSRGAYQAELARLVSLSKFARSAELAQPAAVPGTAVSPKPVRSAALGLAGGLLLGLLFAFARDSMDRRLRNPGEIQSVFQLPVLGHVRDESMGRIPFVGNGSNGAATAGTEFDLDSFRILRRNLDFLEPGEHLRSIVVTSAFPEEGKTTVSASLALVMAVAGKLTLLVECDLRRPQLADRFGIEATPGLSDFLLGRATPKEILRTVEFTVAPSPNGSQPNGANHPGDTHRLVFIPAGTPTANASELLGSQKFKQFLAEVSGAYAAVVIDSSPMLPVADTLELLPSADGILVCARELRTTRDQARAVRAALDHLPHRPAGLVVTGIRPNEDYEGYAYNYAYKLRS